MPIFSPNPLWRNKLNEMGIRGANSLGKIFGGSPENQADNEMRLNRMSNVLASQFQTGPQDLAMPMQISPVYHGSPYKFNKFKNEAIGTGEGAQAVAWGHYVTEDEMNVAMHYKKGRGKYLDTKTGEVVSPEDLLVNDLLQLNTERFKPSEGYLYEATLHKGKHPGEYNYLRWDEQIGDETVKAIKNLPDSRVKKYLLQEIREGIVPDGEDLYKRLASEFGQQEASSLLKRAGIDGIKYPAGSLSGVKSDKFNYVVFAPEDIAIEAVK